MLLLLLTFSYIAGQADQGRSKTSTQSWCSDSLSGPLKVSHQQYSSYGYKFSSTSLLNLIKGFWPGVPKSISKMLYAGSIVSSGSQ